jgi:pyridoxal phosphate enzyme (YggS family)
MENSSAVAARLMQIQERIDTAARQSGRKPEDVSLIAVSKTFGPADILPVMEAAQMCFGENRVQEAQGKWPALRESHPGIELHLIGPLQSNKTKEAVALFDAIQTVDRPKIAAAIAREIAAQGRAPRLFIQVNIGGEQQKAGVAPETAGELLAFCREQHGLAIEGLMCIPPLENAPEPYFERLARLASDLGLGGLSMGMSADFEAAIRCGATHIRVGSAIFGDRPTALISAGGN